jgi:hypothetical protein
MQRKHSILIVNIAQYGKHMDSYKYCHYLNKKYNITYICIDNGLEKIEDLTNVIYIPDTKSSIKNVLNLVKESRKLISENNFNLVFIVYFKLCSLITLFRKNKFVLDIRTGAINKSALERFKFNMGMKLESFFFDHISIISDSLRKKLKYKEERCTIIPLGADILSETNKDFKSKNLKLIYIGTLSLRNIHQTVNGLKKFVDNEEIKNNSINISYDIFGDGIENDVLKLKESIISNNLEKIVCFHGRKNHTEIQKYLDKCNIGVSYIPITEYFDCQPPTKTFEYINSGMICLATQTSENKKIITDKNGILCLDDENSFSESLLKIFNNLSNYNSEDIRKSTEKTTWSEIAISNVDNLFQKIIEANK